MPDLKDLFEGGRWYHCIRHEGLLSNGVYDIDPHLKEYGFEASYAGKTVLDAGSSDGYFSFLFKSRGAARVCAVDSNKYDGAVAISPSAAKAAPYAEKYAAFPRDYETYREIYAAHGLANANKLPLIAKLKGLDVEFRNGSVYDLAGHGTFDISFCGDLLEHLKDPITAIEQLALVTKEKAIIACSSAMELRWFSRFVRKPLLAYRGHESGGSFFEISEAALKAMCAAAGFKSAETAGRFYMQNRKTNSDVYHVVVHALK